MKHIHKANNKKEKKKPIRKLLQKRQMKMKNIYQIRNNAKSKVQ
jgi:hypothetical protein